MTRPNYRTEPVMHWEEPGDRSLCGRQLPTGGFFTDDPGTFEEREGTRCKSCWRIYARRNRWSAPDPERALARCARDGTKLEVITIKDENPIPPPAGWERIPRCAYLYESGRRCVREVDHPPDHSLTPSSGNYGTSADWLLRKVVP